MKYIKQYENEDDFNYIPNVGDYIYLKCLSPKEEYPEIFKVLKKLYRTSVDGYIVDEIDNDSNIPPGSTDNTRYKYKKASDEDVEQYYLRKVANKYNL
jgi:hypothetical protein